MSSRKTGSSRAGLSFPVGRVHRVMKEGKFAERISTGASVYMAGVLEYLTEEILDLAHSAAAANGKTRLTPQHIQMAMRGDEELSQLFTHVTIAEGGVIPFIADALLPKESS